MNNNNYCNKIGSSPYIQEVSTLKNQIEYPTIIELLFSLYDHHFSMVEQQDKDLYIKQRVIELATALDEGKELSYSRFTYNKNMSISNIQYGLQSMKSISALLYLADLYNVTIHVYLQDTKTKVITSKKTKDILHVIYATNKWSAIDFPVGEYIDYKLTDFKDLSTCLHMDVSTIDVYNRYLNPISKYKLSELIALANERNIPLISDDGKKKIKKNIYDDINSYELNKH